MSYIIYLQYNFGGLGTKTDESVPESKTKEKTLLTYRKKYFFV